MYFHFASKERDGTQRRRGHGGPAPGGRRPVGGPRTRPADARPSHVAVGFAEILRDEVVCRAGLRVVSEGALGPAQARWPYDFWEDRPRRSPRPRAGGRVAARRSRSPSSSPGRWSRSGPASGSSAPRPASSPRSASGPRPPGRCSWPVPPSPPGSSAGTPPAAWRPCPGLRERRARGCLPPVRTRPVGFDPHPTGPEVPGAGGGKVLARSEELEPPSFSGLGLRPFKAATRVRIPLGVRSSLAGRSR